MAAEPPEQPSAFDPDPLLGPGGLETPGDERRPAGRARRPADIRDPFRRPPGIQRVAVRIRRSGRIGPAPGRRRSRVLTECCIEAVHRFAEATVAGEGPRQTREIAARRRRAGDGIGVIEVDPAEQSRERADVLAVVPDDVDQRPRLTAAQEIEIQAGDLPAIDVTVPGGSEELDLDGPQTGVGHSMAEDAPDERQ